MPNENDNATTKREDPLAHSVMFWLLIGLAASAFVPAVLGPVWQDRLAWQRRELALEAKVTALQARRDRNADLIERLSSDPATQRRLAMREIGFVPPGERIVQILPDERAFLPEFAKPVKTRRSKRPVRAGSNKSPADCRRFLPIAPS